MIAECIDKHSRIFKTAKAFFGCSDFLIFLYRWCTSSSLREILKKLNIVDQFCLFLFQGNLLTRTQTSISFVVAKGSKRLRSPISPERFVPKKVKRRRKACRKPKTQWLVLIDTEHFYQPPLTKTESCTNHQQVLVVHNGQLLMVQCRGSVFGGSFWKCSISTGKSHLVFGFLCAFFGPFLAQIFSWNTQECGATDILPSSKRSPNESPFSRRFASFAYFSLSRCLKHIISGVENLRIQKILTESFA